MKRLTARSPVTLLITLLAIGGAPRAWGQYGASATGTYTISQSGGRVIYTFTGSGTFTPGVGLTANVLVVAGGGGGGGVLGVSGYGMEGGGGGAGGLVAQNSVSLTSGNPYTATVGAGGAAGTSASKGGNGGNSVFGAYTAIGGGGAGTGAGGGTDYTDALSGGSGGGGGRYDGTYTGVAGAGTSGQGNAGVAAASGLGGGGGGAGAAGSGTTGGSGTASSISGASVYYAGGGGAGALTGYGSPGAGGNGGGGAGTAAGTGGAGTAHRGGGGGGACNNGATVNYNGGAGGSGIVIVSYVWPASAANSTISANPTSLTADGTTTTTITVTAMDGNNNPMSGIPAANIVVAATGTGNTLVQPTTATDVSGQTTATLKSTVAEDKTVSVTINGTLITQTATVTFTPGPLHHFGFAAIATETAGASFDVTITAQDANNNTVPSFTGTVDLTTTAGTISPTTSGAFLDGVRTESVTVTGAGTGKTITATRTGGSETGTSAPFTVNPAAIDHYSVTASSPQSTGVPFPTTVTAQDQFNNTVTTDSSTVVTLSGTGSVEFDSNGDDVYGDNTKTLASGTFNINTKDNVAETVNITATDANSNTGTRTGVVIGPATGDYRTRGNGGGAWSGTTTWQSYSGGTWGDTATPPTSANGTITILSGDTVTVTVGVTVDQVVVSAGGQLTVNNAITLTVANGAGTDLDVLGTLQVIGTGIVGGAGSVQINPGATLGVGSAVGITASGATGSIQNTGARSFSTAANYIYNGTAAQATGNGLPTTLTGTLTIANGVGTGVTLSQNTTMNTPGTCVVNSGALLVMGSAIVLSGSGTFTLSSGGTLAIASTAGITASSASGNIQTTTRTFDSGANYTYNGTAAQVTGDGLPATVNNLTINNSTGVTLSSSLTLSGTLSLTSGAFAVGGNTLTLNGPTIAGTPANLSTTASSSLVFGGSAGSVLIPTSVVALNNLTINNASGVTLQSNPTLSGTLTLTSGAFIITGHTLTLNGAILVTSGSLTGGASTSIAIGGSGAATLPAVTLVNLTINRPSGISLGGSVTLSGALTLTSGDIATGANQVILTATGTVSTPSASSYVNGTVVKTFATGSGLSFTFPIGDASSYTPVGFAALTVGTAGTVAANTTAGDHPSISTSGLNSAKSVNRYWTLTAGGGFAASLNTATFTFINPGDLDAGANTAAFVVRRYSGGSWFPTTTGTRASTSTQITGATSFGDFAIGEQLTDNYLVAATSPQSPGATFTTTVTARDILGQTVVADSSTVVTLGSSTGNVQYDSDGNGVFGDNTKVLTAGVLTINTRDFTSETVDLTATDANSKTGTRSALVIGNQIGDYRSHQTGPWATLATWERWNGTTWVTPAPTAPTTTDGVITIQSGHIVTVAAAASADQVVVAAGGQLAVSTGITLTLANGAGTDLDVFGTVQLNGTGAIAVPANATVAVQSGGSLNCGAGTVSGAGAFTLGSGATLFIGSATGINGNITVTGTKTLASDANYTYNGTAAQVTGALLPTTLTGTLTIANGVGTGVTLSQNTTMNTPGTCVVNSGALLTMGSAIVLSGSGTFTLSSGSTLAIASTAGITASSASGNIQTTTRNFDSGANYTYNGTAAQVTGDGLPATVNNLTINNSTGVTLSSSLTLSGTLSLTSGAFAVGGNTLTLNGPTIAGTPANLSTTASSSLVFGGSAGSVLIPTSVVALNNLTINNASGVTLQSNPTLSGTLTLTSGAFIITGHTLTLNGAILVTSGSLTGGASTSIAIGGSGAATLPTVTLVNLTINRPSGISLGGNVTLSGALTLTSGDIATGANQVILTATGTVSTPSASSYVNGTVVKTFATGSGLSFTFPIGDASSYTPVGFAALTVGTAGTVAANTTAGDHPGISTSGLNSAKSVNRYWTLTAGGGFAASLNTATFTFINPGDLDAGANTAAFVVRRYSGGSWFPTTTGTRASTSTQITGATSFGDFAIGEQLTDNYLVAATSPQSPGATFTTTVTARDILGQTVVADSSTVVTLGSSTGNVQYDSDGNGVFGDNTKVLTAGVLTINTRDFTSETVDLTATDANSKTGTRSALVIGNQIGDYRSHQTGLWATLATWERWNGTTWATPAPTAPTTTDGVITIQSGHIVTVGAAASADQVVVAAGGQLAVSTGITLTLANGAGTDLDVFGTVQLNGTGAIAAPASATVVVQSGGSLNCGTGTVSGAGAFTLGSGATLVIGSATGINGNITVTGTKTFSSGANYTYNGTAAQAVGALLPATVNSLTDNNTVGTVTLAQQTTVTTSVTLAGGAKVSLPATTTSTAAALTIGGVRQAAGTWGASGADHNDTTHFAGTGLLRVSAGAATQLIVTLPNETFTSGSGNGGTVINQTAGTSFNITLTAVDGANHIDTLFTGSQTVGYSGPDNAPDNTPPIYTTTVTFTSGQAGSAATTLTKAETTTITASISGLTGVASSSLTVAPAAHSAFRITPNGSPTAGSPYALTITAVDQYQNIATSVTGDHSFTFAGLATAGDGTHPTITDKNNSRVNVGTATTTTFAGGVCSAGGTLVAYTAESATLTGSDATSGKDTSGAGGIGASLTIANLAPVGGTHYLTTAFNSFLNVSATTLAGLSYDANHDSLTITAVNSPSTHGGTVSLDAGTITYTPATDFAGTDTFTYTVSDAALTGTGTASVTVRPYGSVTSKIIYVSPPEAGTVHLRAYGIPTQAYDIQRSTDPTFPFGSTVVLATQTAASNGVILYDDTSPPEVQAYYRLAVH